jgi:predicted ester cyclase
MSVDQNKAVVKRYFEGDHDGRDNTEIWNELCSPDMTLIAPVFPEPVRGLEPLTQVTAGMHAAFDEFGITVDEMVAEGDVVVARWTMRGKQVGDLQFPGQTFPANGGRMEVAGMSRMRLNGGKLVEEWTIADFVSMMQQLATAS